MASNGPGWLGAIGAVLALCAAFVGGSYAWDALIEAPWAYSFGSQPRLTGT